MKNKWIFSLFLLLILATLLLIGDVHANAAPEYRIDWWTIDGGGATASAGGDFILSGTIGQPENGTSSAGNFEVIGGFWGDGINEYKINLPFVVR